MAVAMKPQARSAGISYQELIRRDVVPPPVTLTLENRIRLGPPTIGAGQPIYDAGVPRSRNARTCGRRFGRWRAATRRFPRRRRLHDVRDRQLLDHRRAHAARISRAPQRMSTSRPTSVRCRWTRLEFHLPVPRLQLEPRRIVAFGDVGVGFSAHRQEELRSERGAVRHVGRLGVHQHGCRTRSRSRSSSASCRSTSRCGSRRSRYIEAHVAKVMAATGRSVRKHSWRRSTSSTRTRRFSLGSATRIRNTTRGAISRARSRRMQRRARTCKFKPSEQELFDSVTMRYLDQPRIAVKCPPARPRER